MIPAAPKAASGCRVYRGDQAMRSIVWALIQHAWYPKRKSKNSARIEREGQNMKRHRKNMPFIKP